MKTFREFIVEATAAGAGTHPDIKNQPEFQKRAAEEMKRRQARRSGTQAAAQNTAQTRSSRTAPNRPYGGEYTPPDVDKKTSRVKDAFNRGRQVAQDLKQKAGEKASKVNQAVRDFGPKAKQTAQNVASDAKTTMKYGRPIRPNTSTSALATRSSELARAANTTSKLSRGLKLAGRAVAPIAFAADVASERSKGSGLLRSLAKGAVSAAGGALGGAAGSVAGPVGTVAGGAAGAAAASRAFDTVAGANAVQRKAMATANRQRQSGGALVGTGGKTTFDTKKNTMTTGNKTVNLAKTSVVKDPKSGKAETGFLAYKGGKAVYKRAADPSTLAQTSSNPLERIGRSLFAGAYKKSDETARQARLAQAAKSDITRQQALGVKGSKNLVGPKIVGPKIVGPKPAK